MELDWDEYASGIKIRRWDSEAGEHKYAVDVNLQEDEMGITMSVVGTHKSNRQIFDLPEDCSELLQYMKYSELDKLIRENSGECFSGDTHYIYSFHDKKGHRIDGNITDGAVKNIYDWIKQEYDWVPEIGDF